MGNKLKAYIDSLYELINSGKKIEDIELLKQELFREIEFWQHERLIHLLVTFLFAIVTVAVLLVLVFYSSIALLILFVLLLVLLIPYMYCMKKSKGDACLTARNGFPRNTE